MATIKGTWLLNDNLTVVNFTQSVNFIFTTKDGFKSNSIFLNYKSENGNTGFVAKFLTTQFWFYCVNGSTGSISGCGVGATLDFGTTEQGVSNDFYNWLTTNASYLSDGYTLPTDKILDLTGATVKIPAGWGVTKGYGMFDLSGTFFLKNILSSGNSYNHSGTFATDQDANFLVGYSSSTNPSAQLIRLNSANDLDVPNGPKKYVSFDCTFYIELKITGGKDATNPALIQWVIDNKAVIEGGIYEGDNEEEEGDLDTLEGITVTLKGFPIKEVDGIIVDNPYSLDIEVNGTVYNSFDFYEDAFRLYTDNGGQLEVLNSSYRLKILGGAEATNPNMINFILTNFNIVTNYVTIAYKGIETTVETGQTATLKFANKKITEDIVIAFIKNGVITYKGVETKVQAGQTATLKCANKKITDDLLVSLVQEETEKKLVDLTGATITVPANWSVSAGYGEFNINGSFGTIPIYDGSDYITLRLGYQITTTGFASKENTFVLAQNYPSADEGYYDIVVYNTSAVLEFSITGGTDVKNQSLIQWFIDNNATIEGGVWE